MMTRCRTVAVTVLVLLTAVPLVAVERVPPVVRAGAPSAQPDWARAELAFLGHASRAVTLFFDRFTDPDTGYCTITTDNWGQWDDIAEAIAQIERLLMVAGSDRDRERYVSTWKGIYHGISQVPNGFRNGYYLRGYDAEHASELLQHLWAAMELAPDDAELREQNRLICERTLECIDPDSHLFKTLYCNSSGGSTDEKHRGMSSSHDMMIVNAWVREWMLSGDERFRSASLALLDAWAAAAAGNDGLLPSLINADGSARADWWQGPFGWDYGIPGVGQRAWHPAMTAGLLLTGGDTSRLQPFASTLAQLVAHAVEGKPASLFDGQTWSVKTEWQSIHLFDRLYDLSWDQRHAAWAKRYGSDFARHAYFGEDIDLAALFDRLNGSAKNWPKRFLDADAKTGDELAEVSPKPRAGFAFINGCYWSIGYDNGRCGALLNAPLRYFRADGGVGLPADMAAWVHAVGADRIGLRLYNAAADSQRVLITGGHYGSHRIDTANGSRVADARVVIELPAKSLAEVELEITRWAYRPTLKPHSDEARPMAKAKRLR